MRAATPCRVNGPFLLLLGKSQSSGAPRPRDSNSSSVVVLHHSGHSRQGEGAVAASRGSTALPAAFSQVINLTWFKRKESKTDKRVLLETEGREEDL